ncbi:hypothetical protein ACWDBT_02175 [Streptomyces ardesiacus]
MPQPPSEGGAPAERPGEDRTLRSLGLDGVPREEPLLYPGAWPRESGLLDGDRLLPLDRPAREAWEQEDGRVPVLAIGSNASPAQLRHKMAEFGIDSPVPMVRSRVTGLDVGVSAHVSRMGYVSASPVGAPGTVRELFVLWLDPGQLAMIDASEGVPMAGGNFDRAWLPAPDVRVEPGDGSVLRGTYAYVNRHGVLHDGTGAPRRHPGEQRPLITELLDGSARLRALFGATPEEFCARARADRRLCDRGTRLLAEEGRVTASGLERYVGRGPDGSRTRGRTPSWGPTAPMP